MIAAHIDNEGRLLAFYDSEIGVPPPAEVEVGKLVEVTPAQREAWMRDASQRWVDGGLTAYVPLPLAPEEHLAGLPPVSHAQIITALIGAGLLTEAEGVDWITGTLPASVEAMIAALPAEQRTIARLRAIRPSSVVPTDPLVAALATAEGKSTEDLIAIFLAAAAL